MPPTAQSNLRLLVISDGPLRGRAYGLREGSQTVGRLEGADVAIPSSGVSGRHAYLVRDGRDVLIADAGSRNGTAVNGRALAANGDGVRLRPGDVVCLGDVELRLEMTSDEATAEVPAARRAPAWDNQFGPIQGTINQAGRDVHAPSWHEHRYEQTEPIDELFRGRGAGRLMLALGLIVAFAGFGLWVWLILSTGASLTDSDELPNPLEREVAGLPAALVGFGAFVGGGIVAGLGSSMSKSARLREENRYRGGAR